MLGAFFWVVVVAYHILMMECTSWTSKRLGSDVSHLEARWSLLGSGEAMCVIIMRYIGICIVMDLTTGPAVQDASISAHLSAL